MNKIDKVLAHDAFRSYSEGNRQKASKQINKDDNFRSS